MRRAATEPESFAAERSSKCPAEIPTEFICNPAMRSTADRHVFALS